jgi:phosphatidylserine decarboxylase
MRLAFSQAKAALIILVLLSAVLAWLYPLLVLVPLLLLAFIFFFYRDPKRTAPEDEQVILAPADGTVTRVASADCDYVGDGSCQISIFMSPFSVHVNRSPIAGVVESVSHQTGKFLPAMNPEAPLVNEKRSYCIRGAAIKVKVVQIAGIMARRTVNWVFQDQEVVQGGKIGMIKLGSCTQVTFPANYKVLVAEGDKVQAGMTIIGRVN